MAQVIIKYKSKKTDEVVTEKEVHEDGAVTFVTESGEEKTLSKATIKRWWTRFEDHTDEEVAQNVAQDELHIADAPQPPTEEELEAEKAKREQKRKKQNDEQKAKRDAENKVAAEAGPIKVFVEQLATKLGLEVVSTNVKNHIKLTVNGKAAVAFNYSKKGVILMFKTKYVGQIEGTKTVNHLFDQRLQLTELDQKSMDAVNEVLKRSKQFIVEEAKAKAAAKAK